MFYIKHTPAGKSQECYGGQCWPSLLETIRSAKLFYRFGMRFRVDEVPMYAVTNL